MSARHKRAIKRQLFGGRATAVCCFCKCALTQATATLEHVVPKSHGGRVNHANIRLSCATCNTDRGDEDFEEYRQKQKERRIEQC